MTETFERRHILSEMEAFYLASKFLGLEARLLDERRFDEWYELLDDEILYEVPIRQARIRFSDETSGGGHIIHDTKRRLKVRVDRLKSGECWSETPPSRTTRVVGSISVELTDRPGVVEVGSALIIYRQRSNDADGDLIAARRTDLLRVDGGRVTLLKRRALLSDTSLRTPNLGVFL